MPGEYTGSLCNWMGAANRTWQANRTAFSFSDPDECGGGTVVQYPAERVRGKGGEWRRVVGTHPDACLERMERTRTVQAGLDRPVSRHGYTYEDANSKIFNDFLNLRWNMTYHLWQVGGLYLLPHTRVIYTLTTAYACHLYAYYRIRVSSLCLLAHTRVISVAARLAL